MRRIIAVVALAMGVGFGFDAQALTMVPRDYPEDSKVQATQNELPMTVAVYQNRIVILATAPQSHEVKADKASVDPTWVKTLTNNAGTPVTLPNLIRALQAEIKNNPKAALPLTLAAFAVAKNSGLNGTSTVSLVIAALQALKTDKLESLDDIAVLIGFAVADSPADQYANVLRQLRNLVIFQAGALNRADFALSLDEALVKHRIVEAENGDEEFFAAMALFLPGADQGDVSEETFDLDMAFFKIENGVYSPADGALLVSPFTGGASGTLTNPAPANNNTVTNPNEPVDPNDPLPSPTPTPGPFPTPTPTPAPPTPVPTPPVPVS